mgnify:CR=1 FL=1
MVLGQSGGVLLRGGKRISRLLGRGYHASKGPFAAEPEPVPLSKLKDSFNDATSVTYLEELEKRYLDDPGSVDRTWASFFKSLGEGAAARHDSRCNIWPAHAQSGAHQWRSANANANGEHASSSSVTRRRRHRCAGRRLCMRCPLRHAPHAPRRVPLPSPQSPGSRGRRLRRPMTNSRRARCGRQAARSQGCCHGAPGSAALCHCLCRLRVTM